MLFVHFCSFLSLYVSVYLRVVFCVQPFGVIKDDNDRVITGEKCHYAANTIIISSFPYCNGLSTGTGVCGVFVCREMFWLGLVFVPWIRTTVTISVPIFHSDFLTVFCSFCRSAYSTPLLNPNGVIGVQSPLTVGRDPCTTLSKIRNRLGNSKRCHSENKCIHGDLFPPLLSHLSMQVLSRNIN